MLWREFIKKYEKPTNIYVVYYVLHYFKTVMNFDRTDLSQSGLHKQKPLRRDFWLIITFNTVTNLLPFYSGSPKMYITHYFFTAVDKQCLSFSKSGHSILELNNRFSRFLYCNNSIHLLFSYYYDWHLQIIRKFKARWLKL